MIGPEVWWHVARAGGIVALVLTGLAVIWGLALQTKLLRAKPTPRWLLSLHKFLASLSVTFTGIHVAGLVADNYLHFGWAEVLLPFASSWRPGAVTLGVISMYLLGAVQLSSIFMKRLPRRLWKGIHLSSYLLFWTGLLHGVMAGSDAGHPLYVLTTALMTLAVVFLTLFRAMGQRRRQRPPTPTLTPERSLNQIPELALAAAKPAAAADLG